MYSRWLESRGQNPRTFPKEAAIFIVRFVTAGCLVMLPIALFAFVAKVVLPPSILTSGAPTTASLKVTPALGLLWGLFCLYLFVAISCMLSYLSGWRQLARHYPAPENFSEGQFFSMQSASIGVVNFNNILRIGVSSKGLYLGCIFPFRLMHPPLLIPWSQVTAVHQTRFLWRTTSYLTIESPKLVTIALFNPKIVETAIQWLPAISL